MRRGLDQMLAWLIGVAATFTLFTIAHFLTEKIASRNKINPELDAALDQKFTLENSPYLQYKFEQTPTEKVMKQPD